MSQAGSSGSSTTGGGVDLAVSVSSARSAPRMRSHSGLVFLPAEAIVSSICSSVGHTNFFLVQVVVSGRS